MNENVAARFLRVSVVVLNYNGWKDTVACVESLLRLDPPAAHIIVVDNASSDGSVEHIKLWARGGIAIELQAPDTLLSTIPVAKPVHLRECSAVNLEELGGDEKRPVLILTRSGENRGYAAGNNIGIRYALARGADAVWILNNDTVVRPDALGEMLSRLFSKERPGLCGALVRYFHDPGTVQCRGGGWTNPVTLLSRLDGGNLPLSDALSEKPESVETRLNFIYGASVMASREFVETVGLMDEGYFLYCEEQDWAFSPRGRFDLAYASSAHVFHKEGRSTGWPTSRLNLRILLLLTRSRLRLAFRRSPSWALPVVAASIVFAMLRIVWRRLCCSR